MDSRITAASYDLDVAPDGDRWRYRKRWRQGLRRFLPSLWHVTDEDGLAVLKRSASTGDPSRGSNSRL